MSQYASFEDLFSGGGFFKTRKDAPHDFVDVNALLRDFYKGEEKRVVEKLAAAKAKEVAQRKAAEAAEAAEWMAEQIKTPAERIEAQDTEMRIIAGGLRLAELARIGEQDRQMRRIAERLRAEADEAEKKTKKRGLELEEEAVSAGKRQKV